MTANKVVIYRCVEASKCKYHSRYNPNEEEANKGKCEHLSLAYCEGWVCRSKEAQEAANGRTK